MKKNADDVSNVRQRNFSLTFNNADTNYKDVNQKCANEPYGSFAWFEIQPHIYVIIELVQYTDMVHCFQSCQEAKYENQPSSVFLFSLFLI